MTKFIGPQYSIGIGKESTRATAVAAAYWMPWSSLSIDDKVKFAKDDTSRGVIEGGVGQEITTFTSEATLDGIMLDQSFGLILKALFGTETKTTVESGVDQHAFSVSESAQHPSLTLSVYGPNESSGLAYPLAMLDTLDIDFELDKYATYKAVFKANKNTAQSNTVAFVSENRFRPQDGLFAIAPTLAGANGTLAATGTCSSTTAVTGLSISATTLLQVGMTVTGTNIPAGTTISAIGSASAITLSQASTGSATSYTFGPAPVQIKKLSLSFKKNTEDDEVFGTQSPIDRLNKAFGLSGSFELYYTDRTMIDTYLLGDLYKAFHVAFANTSVLIGAVSHPTFFLNVAKAKLSEVARKFDAGKNITMQTVKFDCFFSLSDSELCDAGLINTNTSVY
jgi:hypothetical protein